MVAFVGLAYLVRNKILVSPYIHLDKRVVDKAVGTLMVLMPLSLDILLDILKAGMAVDTLMVEASLAFEIACIQLGMMVAYKALDIELVLMPLS